MSSNTMRHSNASRDRASQLPIRFDDPPDAKQINLALEKGLTVLCQINAINVNDPLVVRGARKIAQDVVQVRILEGWRVPDRVWTVEGINDRSWPF